MCSDKQNCRYTSRPAAPLVTIEIVPMVQKYQSWLNLQKNLYAATAIGFQMKRLVRHVELRAEKEKEPF